MVALQTLRRTCTARIILERPGEIGAIELRCGLAEHGGGMHCDSGLFGGPVDEPHELRGLWWMSASA